MVYSWWFLFCIAILVCFHEVRGQCSGSSLDSTLSTYEKGSLNYPNTAPYTENLNCAWKVAALDPSNADVLIYVQINQLRANDILNIYDGADNTGPNLFSSSVTGTSGQTTTTVAASGTAYISFVSDAVADTNQNGFTLTYMAGAANSNGACSSAASLTATDTTQYITTANFPTVYSSDSSCTWTISAQGGCGTLSLSFIYIDIEQDGSCSLDKVTVQYDGSTQATLCGESNWNPSSDYSTTGTSATIAMTSDDSEEFRGFVMSYTRTGCTTTAAVTTTTVTTTASGAGVGSGTVSSLETGQSDDAGKIAGGTVGGVAGVAAISTGVVLALKYKGLIGGATSSIQPGGHKKALPSDSEHPSEYKKDECIGNEADIEKGDAGGDYVIPVAEPAVVITD